MAHRILIADDDEFLTQMYRFTLDGEDRTLEIVHDGEAAIASITKEKPDALLLDLLMPKVDGFGVLEAVRGKGYTFPIIILSNVNDTVDQAKCREMGATDFYNKSSTDLEGLSALIKKYLTA